MVTRSEDSLHPQVEDEYISIAKMFSELPADSSVESATTFDSDAVFVGSGREAIRDARRGLHSLLLFGALAVAVTAVAAIALRGANEQAALFSNHVRPVNSVGVSIAPVEKVLASRFVDANNDMVADPPGSPAEYVDPQTLVVAHYEGDYEEDPRVNWDAFKAHLETATGRKVVLQEYLNTAAEVAQITLGKIHVVVPHAADVPCLVNNAGVVPFAALGTEEGPNGNHMVIVVRPDSKVKSLADIRSKTLTCTRPHSITGYRAAVTTLAQQANMRLDSDYHVFLTDGQARSIRGLEARLFEVAAISHDKLQWALANGVINKSQYRVVYESEVIPRLTICHIHSLEPALAEKLTQAALTFGNHRTVGEEWTAPPMRFYSVNYKRDFEFVRKMDDSFVPRCGPLLTAQLDQ